MIPDVIFSLLKIHTQHSKKPSPLPAGASCFLFLFFAQVQRKLRHWCRGESSAWRCTDKGGYSLSRKRVSPLNPREKGRGVLPLDPAYIGSLWLEELRGLRNRVRCTWLRHESLHFVTIRNRALLPWGASDGSTAADCLRGRLCCARRGWDCCFSISTVFFSVNGPQLMEIRTGQLRDLA